MKALLQEGLSEFNCITVSRDELDSMSIPVNYVLVRLHRGNDQVTINKGLPNEQNLFIPVGKGNQEQHAPIYCTVVKVCEKTIIRPSDGGLWETDIELLEDDEVIVQYLHMISSLGGYYDKQEGEQRHFVCEGDTYVYIPYHSVYCALRDEEIFPVNGWCFGEAVELPSHGLQVDTQESEWQCIITHVGTPNKCYPDKDKYGNEVFFDDAEVEVGDLVLMEGQHFLHHMEVELHRMLSKPYLCFQRQHVCAKLSSVIYK
jgi:hypothetical protein